MTNMEQWYFITKECFYRNTIIEFLGIEFIIAFFNRNTWDAIHVIAIYKPPKTKVFNFKIFLKHYPLIVQL
jgi:hypothetical protein